jgi:hypothetical protein
MAGVASKSLLNPAANARLRTFSYPTISASRTVATFSEYISAVRSVTSPKYSCL